MRVFLREGSPFWGGGINPTVGEGHIAPNKESKNMRKKKIIDSGRRRGTVPSKKEAYRAGGKMFR